MLTISVKTKTKRKWRTFLNTKGKNKPEHTFKKLPAFTLLVFHTNILTARHGNSFKDQYKYNICAEIETYFA